jgi:hypothetical protein
LKDITVKGDDAECYDAASQIQSRTEDTLQKHHHHWNDSYSVSPPALYPPEPGSAVSPVRSIHPRWFTVKKLDQTLVEPERKDMAPALRDTAEQQRKDRVRRKEYLGEMKIAEKNIREEIEAGAHSNDDNTAVFRLIFPEEDIRAWSANKPAVSGRLDSKCVGSCSSPDMMEFIYKGSAAEGVRDQGGTRRHYWGG